MRKGNYEQLKARLLDDGQFVDPDHFARRGAEFSEALRASTGIMQDVEARKPKPSDAVIRGEPGPDNGKASVIVTVT